MKDEIKNFFKGDVEDSETTLRKYSHDASVFEIKPQLVLFPKDSKDVQNLVKWVSENKERYPNLAITPRAAGTDMSGGSIGESLILDFTRYMNRLIKFQEQQENSRVFTHPGVPGGAYADSNSLTVPSITVQPGMFYRDFEKITLERGLILPCYTASKSINAVGGMYGNNSAGERTLKYGKTEDYVLEAKVVFADGVERVIKPHPLAQIDKDSEYARRVYTLIKQNEGDIALAKPKVHKNSAGYYLWNVIQGDVFDLNKLLVGSQGTLGIVTEITFRLIPERKYSNLTVIFLQDLAPLGRLVEEILHYKPETLEAYDEKTMQLAVKFFWDFLKNKGIFGMIKFLWSFLPEFRMMRSGFPKMILLAEFAGADEVEAINKCLSLEEKLKNFNLKIRCTQSQAEAQKYWDIRRESFALLRKHVKGRHTAPFIDDITVRPEFLPKFLPELNKILDQYDLIYTIAGHAGDGNFHIIPLMDFGDERTKSIILELSDKVYDLVLRYHGSITAEHNDGFIRTPFLERMYGLKITSLFKEVKSIFDPQNIFNPGKKVPIPGGAGTKSYLASHIAIEHKVTHKV